MGAMANYSVTLNFFVPQDIVENLKKVNIHWDMVYDYRFSIFSHCTIKAISHHELSPSKELLDHYIQVSQNILYNYKSFEVEVADLAKFSTTVFAHLYSNTLLALHHDLCKQLPSSQAHFENQNFIPHVSIATIKDSGVEITSSPKAFFGKFLVQEVQLMVRDKDIEKSIIYHTFFLP